MLCKLSHSNSSLLGGAVASVVVNGMVVVTLGYIGNDSQTNEIYIIICHQLMIFIGFQGYHAPSEHSTALIAITDWGHNL